LLHFVRVLTNKAVEANEGKPLPLVQKALIGLTAGAIGASVGSPADLALIRMQADSGLPAAQRRNYKNAFHALYPIVADEGVLSLWKGAWADRSKSYVPKHGHACLL
jgi:solute carrier family 25 (mitochondrial oxoglutarate transporter), member 11